MNNGFRKINSLITQRMIDRINETGILPWKKPWASVSMMPRNLVSKKPYRGANAFLLHALGYASPFFLSMKQVNELGGRVRKGERSCPVVFWRIVDAKEDNPDQKGYAMLRYFRVFNSAQCDGLEGKVPEVVVPQREHEPLEIAEQLLANMPNNLHIVVARAETEEEAMSEVEGYIEGWGDENNWRSIAGAVGEDCTWYSGDGDSRYSGPCTLEELNKALMDAVQLNPDERVKHAITMLAAGDYDGLVEGTPTEVCSRTYALKEFVDRLHAVYSAGMLGKDAAKDRSGPLPIFDISFRPWEYTEFGVTHIGDTAEEDGMRYAVLVDMHS